MAPKDVENDLIRPAVNGTVNVMHACVARANILRSSAVESGISGWEPFPIVITSSDSAVVSENKPQGYVFTEEDWHDAHDEYEFDSQL